MPLSSMEFGGFLTQHRQLMNKPADGGDRMVPRASNRPVGWRVARYPQVASSRDKIDGDSFSGLSPCEALLPRGSRSMLAPPKADSFVCDFIPG